MTAEDAGAGVQAGTLVLTVRPDFMNPLAMMMAGNRKTGLNRPRSG